jgi:deazaflavin-dependent oxidoreductase (nitroreductase family)
MNKEANMSARIEAKAGLPRWLKPANRVIIALQHVLGVPLGTIHVLSIPGRKTGKLRATPVSLMTVDGKRYVIGGLPDADWVKNAQASGWGVLAYGRKAERVALVELPAEERAPILRDFPRLVPHGVQFFQQVYGLSKDPATLPEEFEQLASTCPVFRLDPAPKSGTGAAG